MLLLTASQCSSSPLLNAPPHRFSMLLLTALKNGRYEGSRDRYIEHKHRERLLPIFPARDLKDMIGSLAMEKEGRMR
ncbi:hypothetical protein BU17DRAFT_81878 [Hysterangium stoloniferum]|nr:hypothetical protein BU17DRAFT_81878 [Hysterangium stoloniferum]